MNQNEPQQNAFVPADDAIARHREELKKRFPLPPPAKKSNPRSLTTLSVVITMLGVVCALLWLDPSYQSEQFGSAIGEQQVIQLADGSRITLDAASRLNVSWHLRSRRVELQAGQAFFSVTPALYRPFLTTAGSTQIKVVGTRYNVSRYQNDVRVTVEEGKVDVRGHAANIRLTAGDQVLVHNGRLGKPTQVDAAAFAAWKEGRLVFDRTPLREVLAVIQRYQSNPIVMHDSSLEELPVSGTFDSAHLDRMLALLPKIIPLDLTTDSQGTLRLQRRAAKNK
ncbi:MAG: FecR domain-containing protein [Gammaproteobacteria bacterium]|nr:FecR domain-containing protein [Gammaproteobacteria bacterium]MBU1489365.1 FecR domain-containing protein [Gammaproteobacteria bacterium]MBU2065242.1 FecR domain-containing protein [Gammaproteobacteria bacterium]MBU2141123.1 FecR domain-containing protein [Gammaproteobacteria bacterium]MBU2215346.1 FecR domain-containing protein [Gammaproteobacteria bacterium]